VSPGWIHKIGKKDIKAVMKTRPARSQQQHSRTEQGNRMKLRAAGETEEETVDDVQPGKFAVRRGHLRGSHIGVAPVI
jgi:hypothetical protein